MPTDPANPASNPDTRLLDNRLKKLLDEKGGDGSGSGDDGSIGERVARLEGVFEAFRNTVEGLRHSQNLVVAIVSLLALVLIGLSVYEMQRLDQLNDQLIQTNQRVSEVPGKVSDDLRNLTQTLAATITAARQPAPASQPPAKSH